MNEGQIASTRNRVVAVEDYEQYYEEFHVESILNLLALCARKRRSIMLMLLMLDR